jgi:hypothetical protein
LSTIIKNKKRKSHPHRGGLFSLMFYLTASFNPFPALNFGVFIAGILIFSPVLGFLPSLAALAPTLNVPKPVRVTSSPLDNAFVIGFDYYASIPYIGYLVPCNMTVFCPMQFVPEIIYNNNNNYYYYYYYLLSCISIKISYK